MIPSSTRRHAAITLAVSGLALAGAVIPTTTGHAASSRPPAHAAKAKPVIAGSTYLALGDSVPFGYRESATTPAPNYAKASTFVGYPALVAKKDHLKLVNAACPGETSASFLKTSAASNGCENTYNATTKKQDKTGYRTEHPLHVKYASKTESQLTFAEKYIKAHKKKVKLISIMVGANDLFLCQVNTADGCGSLAEVNATVTKVQKNVTKIVKGLRKTAKYTGQIVLEQYYSTDYTASGALVTGAVEDLNTHLAQAVAGYQVALASAFPAFKSASTSTGGDDCTAGLLTVTDATTSPITCGVHPSAKGAAILATTVEKKIKK